MSSLVPSYPFTRLTLPSAAEGLVLRSAGDPGSRYPIPLCYPATMDEGGGAKQIALEGAPAEGNTAVVPTLRWQGGSGCTEPSAGASVESTQTSEGQAEERWLGSGGGGDHQGLT